MQCTCLKRGVLHIRNLNKSSIFSIVFFGQHLVINLALIKYALKLKEAITVV